MDKTVVISLKDVESGLLYTTCLSSNDAHRVNTDNVFATQVLNTLKKKQREMDQLASTASKVLTVDDKNRPLDSTISTALTFDDTICPPEKHDVEEAFKWSHEAILLLVEEYRGHEKKMTSGKLSQKHVWELISGALRSNEYCVSGPQCQSKFNGMKRTFKSIKDHNARSGNAPRAWPYMEVMEAFLGEKPFMNPVAVASSTGTTGIESEDSDISMDNCDISVSCKSSRKRKAFNVAEAIMESRRIGEENRQRRHEQIIEQRAKLLNALDKLIDKF